MESNKNSFEIIKETLITLLDTVNEENMGIKRGLDALLEENSKLNQEVSTLKENVKKLEDFIEVLKNIPINTIPDKLLETQNSQINIVEQDRDDIIEEEEVAFELDLQEVMSDSFAETENELEVLSELEAESELEPESEQEQEVELVPEPEPKIELEHEHELEQETEPEPEIIKSIELVEERNITEVSSIVEFESESVVESAAESAAAVAAAEEEDDDDDEYVEIDVNESEVKEKVSSEKILHEAIKPEWYDWEVDYPAPYTESILDGIGFNDKLLFIRELFNEDDELFNKTIDKLNTFEEFKDATTYIRDNFSHWDEESDVVYRFYMSVRRKLRK